MGERSFLLEISGAPDDCSGQELLEIVLAAASLELDLVVVFSGDGLEQVAGERARGWRQLIDHELAPLYWRPRKSAPEDLMPGLILLDESARPAVYEGRCVLRLSV